MKHIHFDDVHAATDQEVRQILEAILLHFKLQVVIYEHKGKQIAVAHPEL